MSQLIEDIRQGVIDINNQQNIFSILLKGLIVDLNNGISIRGIPVPHMILHTGDDTMYLENKNLNYSAESIEVTNENYVYNIIPRCILNPGGVNFMTDQLTSSHAIGQLQIEYKDDIHRLVGEFRRLPFNIGVELQYYLDTFTDKLELMQQVATKLAFIRTYKIVYLGQVITCSYKIPESMQGEWMMELDGSIDGNRSKKVNISLEIECNLPVFEPRTIMDPSIQVSDSGAGICAHEYKHLEEEGPVKPYEVIGRIKNEWKES